MILSAQIIVAGNVLAMVLGLAGIGGLAVAKAQDTVVLVSSNILPIVNVSVLACTIMAMIVAATASIWRLHAIGKHKKWYANKNMRVSLHLAGTHVFA